MIHETISHYRVLEKLGEGAMGEVYLAEDARLHRRIALKFLAAHLSGDSAFKDRFVDEARAASALDHPNVCAVYDIGESTDGRLFIAMPAYEGSPLDSLLEEEGPLPVEKAVDIIRQAASGLAAAHRKNIIHRDIKPANIFVTYDGRAVILDFGLAKLAGEEAQGSGNNSEGTAAYRAPEQIRGDTIDARTDIWALGMVFYEMMAGWRPFSGPYESAVSYQILNEPPDPLPPGDDPALKVVGEIIEKALAKDPGARFTDVAAFLDAFSALRPSAAPAAAMETSRRTESISIAVLPFNDMSREQDQAYFCDGITEELIDGLSRVDAWSVVSRTSSFALRASGLDVTGIGERLRATHVVEGSLRKAGNRIRVSAQMVGVSDGYQLWSDRYDRELEDIFDIQDEIAHAIVENLKIELGVREQERIIQRNTENAEAHNLYLQGRYSLGQRSESALAEAISLFRKAISLDPNFAHPHAGLADAYILQSFQGVAPASLLMPKAIIASERAMNLDDELVEAVISRACAAAVFEWDWARAQELFERAARISPNNATAHHWYAIWVLLPLGRLEQAYVELYHAESLDPLSMIIQAGIGWQHYFDRRYEAAEAQLLRTLETFPESVVALDLLGQSVLLMGRSEEGISHIEKAVRISSRRTLSLASLAHGLAVAGRHIEAEEILRELTARAEVGFVSRFDLALVHTGLGDKESAFDELDRAVEDKNGWLCFLNVEPRLDPLRTDVRFAALVDRVGLARNARPVRAAAGRGASS